MGSLFSKFDPDALNLNNFLGRHIKVTSDDHKERVVEIEHIVGSAAPQHGSKLQINGQYLISMLDFYGQIYNEKYTKEEIAAFDADFRQEMIHVTKIGQPGLEKRRSGIWTTKK